MKTEIPPDEADSWFTYLVLECTKRNWSCGNFKELNAQENRGVTTVVDAAGSGVLELRWRRKRKGALLIDAEIKSLSALSRAGLNDFLTDIGNQNRLGAGSKNYGYAYFLVNGCRLPGEFWLDAETRLRGVDAGPDHALLGEWVIEIDTLIFGADVHDSAYKFQLRLKEMAVFLSAMWGKYLRLPEDGEVWVLNTDLTSSELRYRGYVGDKRPHSMPKMNAKMAALTHKVTRPWFWDAHRDPDGTVFMIPADTVDLWGRFLALTVAQRGHFLRAANKLYESKHVTKISPTLSFALKVAACEALKPEGKKFDSWLAPKVVEELLGKGIAKRLKDGLFSLNEHGTRNSTTVRDQNFHRGIFWDSEFELRMFFSSYDDPTFGDAHRFVSEVAREALVAWLNGPLLAK